MHVCLVFWRGSYWSPSLGISLNNMLRYCHLVSYRAEGFKRLCPCWSAFKVTSVLGLGLVCLFVCSYNWNEYLLLMDAEICCLFVKNLIIESLWSELLISQHCGNWAIGGIHLVSNAGLTVIIPLRLIVFVSRYRASWLIITCFTVTSEVQQVLFMF